MPECTEDFPAGQKLAEDHQDVVASLRELSLRRFPRALARAAMRSIAFSLAAITANVTAVEAAALTVQKEIAKVRAVEEAEAARAAQAAEFVPLTPSGMLTEPWAGSSPSFWVVGVGTGSGRTVPSSMSASSSSLLVA